MKLIFFVYILIPIMSLAMGKCKYNKLKSNWRYRSNQTFSAVDICSLPRVTGPCMAENNRFAYSRIAKRCFPFVYGGCVGNANNFVSMQACESACKGK